MDLLVDEFMVEPDAIKYLENYDIPYPKYGLATSEEEAVEIAEHLGYPVVLKIVSVDVHHKTEAGGVIIGLKKSDEVKESFSSMIKKIEASLPNASIKGVMVCKQADEGLEVIVGALNDAVFGPTVMFGLGGVFTELMKDVTFRIVPLQRIDAEEMIKEIKGYPLLLGVRNSPPCDINRLIDLILAVSKLIEEDHNIKELDLNPIRLYQKGLVALDVRLVKWAARKSRNIQ